MTALKLTTYLIIFMAVGFACNSNNSDNKGVNGELNNTSETNYDNKSSNNLPEIKFDKLTHDFGVIQQGEKVSYTFKFKNIGLGDLIIKEAKATCGCTVPKYSREPITSGGEGSIEVIFDSNNRNGRQLKTITVWTNCQPEQIKLEIVSEIVVPK